MNQLLGGKPGLPWINFKSANRYIASTYIYIYIYIYRCHWCIHYTSYVLYVHCRTGILVSYSIHWIHKLIKCVASQLPSGRGTGRDDRSILCYGITKTMNRCMIMPVLPKRIETGCFGKLLLFVVDSEQSVQQPQQPKINGRLKIQEKKKDHQILRRFAGHNRSASAFPESENQVIIRFSCDHFNVLFEQFTIDWFSRNWMINYPANFWGIQSAYPHPYVLFLRNQPKSSAVAWQTYCAFLVQWFKNIWTHKLPDIKLWSQVTSGGNLVLKAVVRCLLASCTLNIYTYYIYYIIYIYVYNIICLSSSTCSAIIYMRN